MAVLAALAAAPPAHAGFQPVNSPPDVRPAGPRDVSAVIAVGGSWFVVTEDGDGWISADRGATWNRVAGAYPGDVTEGPDGAVYYGGQDGDGNPAIHRLTESGPGGVKRLQVGPEDRGSIVTPAFDERGGLWVFLSHFRNLNADKPVLSLLRMAPDYETVAERLELGVPKPFDAVSVFRFAAGRAYIRLGTTFASPTLSLEGARLVARDGSAATIGGKGFTPPSMLPAVTVGETVVGFAGISVDGGDNWGQLWRAGSIRPVAGDKSLLVRGGWILRRAGEAFAFTGLGLPQGAVELAAVRGGLLAVGAGIWFHAGDVPDAAPVGSPSAYTRRLAARLNDFRREAGLPPVIADAKLEQAALGHARYLTRNRVAPGVAAPALHRQRRGAPGFTGELGEDRCKAVGATCTDDVIAAGPKAARPIDIWVASLYHRLPLLSPGTTAIGAARSGRYVVLNFDETGRRGLGLGPSGFPVGSYRGPLTAVSELPDPRDACLRNGRRIRRAGPAVTFRTPTEEPPAVPNQAFIQLWPLPDVMDVKLFRAGRAVRGCTKVGHLRRPQQHIAFIPEGPLRRASTYRAVARWRINPAAPVRSFAWTFKTR